MKDVTKKGILATMCLTNLTEESRQILEEQTQEIKPSRLNNKVLNKKKKKSKRDYEDDYEE